MILFCKASRAGPLPSKNITERARERVQWAQFSYVPLSVWLNIKRVSDTNDVFRQNAELVLLWRIMFRRYAVIVLELRLGAHFPRRFEVAPTTQLSHASWKLSVKQFTALGISKGP